MALTPLIRPSVKVLYVRASGNMLYTYRDVHSYPFPRHQPQKYLDEQTRLGQFSQVPPKAGQDPDEWLVVELNHLRKELPSSRGKLYSKGEGNVVSMMYFQTSHLTTVNHMRDRVECTVRGSQTWRMYSQFLA